MTPLKVLSNNQSKIIVQSQEEEKGHICLSWKLLYKHKNEDLHEKGWQSLVQIIQICLSRTILNIFSSSGFSLYLYISTFTIWDISCKMMPFVLKPL